MYGAHVLSCQSVFYAEHCPRPTNMRFHIPSLRPPHPSPTCTTYRQSIDFIDIWWRSRAGECAEHVELINGWRACVAWTSSNACLHGMYANTSTQWRAFMACPCLHDDLSLRAFMAIYACVPSWHAFACMVIYACVPSWHALACMT